MKTIKLIKVTTLFLGAVSILSLIETCTKKIESHSLPNNQTTAQDSTEYTGHKPIEISLDGSGYSKSILIKSDQEGVIETTSSTGTKYTFAIPKNAVSQNDSIRVTITPIINVKNLPQHKKFLAAIQFEPEGLTLLKPAILTILIPESVPQDSLVGFSYQGVGNDFHLIPLATKDTILSPIQSISLAILHFSGVIVGLGTLSDCTNQGSPTDPQSLYEQGIACVLNNAARRDGKMTLVDNNQIHNILLAWFDQIVLPKLNSATNLDELKEVINNTFARWYNAAGKWFQIPDDFREQFNSAGIPIKAMLDRDLSKLNIDCSNETDPCKLIKYFTEYQQWQVVNQAFFQAVNINIDFLDFYNFCAGKMLTTMTQVKIKGPREITMSTIDSISFTAELKNDINEPIDGKVYWKAIPVNNSAITLGAFKNPLIPTFVGAREGEVFIVASAITLGNSYPLDCITDTVRVKIVPDCDKNPLQPDCHSKWEGSVQIPCEDLRFCGQTCCNCNGGCETRWYFLEDLKLTFEFGDSLAYGQVIGKLYVTGTDNVNYSACLYGCGTGEYCISSNEVHSMDQENDLIVVYNKIVDSYFGFLSSYNDFNGWFSNRLYSFGFTIRGSIHGDSGSITITHANRSESVGVDGFIETYVDTQVVLSKTLK